MNPKTGLYTVFALALFFLPLLHTESMDSITGRVTSYSNNQPSYYGKYTLPADYQAKINADFAIYEDLRLKAANLVQDVLDCESSQELDRCISTRKDRSWNTECGDEEEKVFFNLVDDIESCGLAEDNYCLCRFPLLPDPAYGQGQVGLTIFNTSSGTLIRLAGHEHAIKGIDTLADILDNGKFMASGAAEFLVSLDHDGQKAEVLASSIPRKFNDEVLVYKQDDSLIFVTYNDVQAWQQNKGYQIRNCTVNNKRIYRFCVDSGKEVAGQALEYRFALDFRDDTAPAQPIVNIMGGDSHIAMSWARAPEADHYNIYVSMVPFSDITGMDVSLSTKGDYADLYYFYDKGIRYPFINEQMYHVAVVPVDKSNNHLKTGLTILSAMPKSLNSTTAGLIP